MSTTVGVLRGGPSSEYKISLQTGGAVLRNLPPQYKPIDILIEKNGAWFCGGVSLPPERIIPRVQVIFNALHGYYGEDGKVQQLLDKWGVPYTGSRSLASALGMNKAMAKRIFRTEGIKTPHAATFQRNTAWNKNAFELYRSFPQPSVIKPVSGGSSIGTTIAHTFADFFEGLKRAFHFSDSVLIEEHIKGREGTCGVIDRFRGQEYYALPPIEIIPPSGRFFDYENKYDGSTREVCPAYFSQSEKREIMDLAIRAHRALGLRHYSRSDFIVSKRGIYILEVNTLPGLTEESLLPKACKAVGCSFPDFLDHTIQLALGRR